MTLSHCVYLFKDPKTDIWRYVGKGALSRPLQHFRRATNPRLSAMLNKRVLENFVPQPVIIHAKSDADAIEMEILLIAMIGRKDTGSGTLFNHTDGGDGAVGRVDSPDTFSKKSAAKRRMHAERSEELKKSIARKVGARPCTIDGKTIFHNRLELVAALGQGKNGSRSPNFRYLTSEEKTNG